MTSYLRPRDLDEALAARAAHPDWMVLAGGTDLMVNANHREAPAGILDLWRLSAIGFVRISDDSIAIGAGTTWHDVDSRFDYRSIDVLMPADAITRALFVQLIMEPGCDTYRWLRELKQTNRQRYDDVCHQLRSDERAKRCAPGQVQHTRLRRVVLA